MARPRNGGDTRQHILDCAIALFRQNGYDAVTLQQICQSASISKNTFYYHFVSKGELLYEHYVRSNTMDAARIASLLSADNYVEQLWKIDEAFLDFIIESGCDMVRHLFAQEVIRDINSYKSAHIRSDMARTEEQLVAKAQKAGQIGNQSPPANIIAVKNDLLLGATMAWCVKQGGFDVRSYVRRGFETLLDPICSTERNGAASKADSTAGSKKEGLEWRL